MRDRRRQTPDSGPEPDALVVERSVQAILDRLAAAGAAALLSPWMTVPEAAAYMRLTVDRVHRLAAARAIPHRREGRRILFHRHELDLWLNTYREGPDMTGELEWPTFPRRFRDPTNPHEQRAYGGSSIRATGRRGGDRQDE